MEMTGTHNLLEKTKKSIEEISYWTWPELLIALKQQQHLLSVSPNSSVILERCLDSLVGRLGLSLETSPSASTSSPDSSGFRFSCDTKSTESLKNSFSRATWWFEDLSVFSPNLIEMVVKSMVSHKLDHSVINRFLLYYHKSRIYSSSSVEKRKIVETVIDMLYILDRSSVSCKSLFGILRVSLGLNICKSCRNKLETMIGYQMGEATLDNLLIPPPYGTSYLYDVNLVLRFVKAFLSRGGCRPSIPRLKKVASLVDLYMSEVAPDPCLKPSKFLALVLTLPDSARDSHDAIYSAMDMYLEVHTGLSEEERVKICCALNYEKLSAETCMHLSGNTKFPSKTAVHALISQQSKLKSLLRCTKNSHPSTNSPCWLSAITSKENYKDEASKQVVLYAGKLDITADNEKLRAHLKGMQWRVTELEKVCRKMQNQMGKIMRSRISSHTSPKSLPRLCS